MNVCKACRSPKRAEIDKALVEKVPFRNIVEQYGVSLGALQRHKKDHLQQVIENTNKIIDAKNGNNAERVRQEMNYIAYSDPIDCFDEKGQARDIREMPEAMRRAIGGFEFVNLYEDSGDQKHCFGQLRKFRMWNKVEALKLLGQDFGMFKQAETTPPKVEVLVTTHYIGTPPSADVTVQVIPNLPAPKNGGNGNGHK